MTRTLLVGLSLVGALLAFAPAAQAHNCNALLGSMQCGSCSGPGYHYHAGLLFGCDSCCASEAGGEGAESKSFAERAGNAIRGAWAGFAAFVGLA